MLMPSGVSIQPKVPKQLECNGGMASESPAVFADISAIMFNFKSA
jgi:hypothetical protein